MRSIVCAVVTMAAFLFTTPALASAVQQPSTASSSTAVPSGTPEKCDHGVARAVCSRCNPKLEPVYKAKGDWCAEHRRPESQCVVCHPELAKKGVK